MSGHKQPDIARLDRVVADARRHAAERERSYREQALKLFPWICGRCAREFTRANVQQLTVHHRDHNHDNNPPDGSNWELLCVYCHDDEHARQLDSANRAQATATGMPSRAATYQPFAELRNRLLKKNPPGDETP